MRTYWPILSIFLLLIGACSDGPSGPSAESGVTALAVAGGIVVVNGDDVARHHVLVEDETATLVDLNFDPEGEEGWIRIPAGESRLVPWSAILGFHAGARTVVVHSWIDVRQHSVSGGVQWVAEGFVTRSVEVASADADPDTTAEAVAEARARWDALGPDDYRFILHRSCFCGNTGDFVVEVVDGVTVAARHAVTGEAVERLEDLPAVDAQFDLLEAELARPADRVLVAFDAALGFPTSIDVDPDFQTSDDEVSYRIRELPTDR